MEYRTIPGFESLTQQAMFDMAVAHLTATGVKSGTGGACFYSGSGCAAAPLLIPEMREATDVAGGWSQVVKKGLAPTHERTFIIDLQAAHDMCSERRFLPEWKGRMLALAASYGLDTTDLLERTAGVTAISPD